MHGDLKGNSCDSVRHYRNIEVEQQSDMKSRDLQVCLNLGFVHWKYLFDRLDLNDDHPVDDHIWTVYGSNEMGLVDQGN